MVCHLDRELLDQRKETKEVDPWKKISVQENNKREEMGKPLRIKRKKVEE